VIRRLSHRHFPFNSRSKNRLSSKGTLLAPSFLVARESGPGESPPLHSFGCQAHSWRCIIFARVSKRSLTFAFLLLSANLSGTSHHLALLPCDCSFGRLCTSYMRPIVLFVQSSSFLDGRTGFSANLSGAERHDALHCDCWKGSSRAT
jgi:hypothetical protein